MRGQPHVVQKAIAISILIEQVWPTYYIVVVQWSDVEVSLGWSKNNLRHKSWRCWPPAPILLPIGCLLCDIPHRRALGCYIYLVSAQCMRAYCK